jgi:two-component system chemotaxis sensor kinase CheA
MPEERIAADKEPLGKVKLGFSNEGNYLIITVQDDGHGIDAERLRSKALQKGIISETQSYTEKQLLHLIFNAGFSTKEQTSEISGRGVGMDVVKTNIEKIGGQVDLQTNLGFGTRFDIKIPLSLAVIEGLVVKTSGGRFVVPLNQVQETINLADLHIHSNKLGMGDCIEMRSSVVPLLSLDSILGSNKEKTQNANQGIALVFEVNSQLIAVSVQEVVRSQQVVIKPLGNGIKGQKGWVGTCVLGDGLPTLILSPNDLLENRIVQRRAA